MTSNASWTGAGAGADVPHAERVPARRIREGICLRSMDSAVESGAESDE